MRPRVFLFAAITACLGLGVAYWASRNHAPLKQQNPASLRAEDALLPAVELEGLRYLPADTNVVFAVQPGAVVAYAKRTNQDPRDLAIRAGIPARVMDTLTTLGLSLAQFDHIAGGTSLGNAAVEFRLTLVLVLRRPLDNEDKFLAALKAKQQPGGHDHYDVEFAGLPLTLACVAPTVYVFGADKQRDLAGARPGTFGPGGKQFPSELARVISDQVPGDAAAWVATNEERWAEKPAVKLVVETLLKKKEWTPVLAQGRGAMAALMLGEQPRLRLVVKAADADAARKARAFFAERAGVDGKVQHGGEGEAAFMETPIDPATAFATVQQLLGDPAKK